MAHQFTETRDVLSGVRLFRGLSGNQLDEAAAASRRIRKEPGADFFRQGQDARYLFVVVGGQVKVSQITPEGHQIVVRYAGPGEMFGCAPLYGGKEYPATATAVIPGEALAWDRPAMDRLMERYPAIALNALELLGEELYETRARYQELATERVERRVARALLRLVAQGGRRVEGGVLINFPVTRQDLAEITGTTLHTVSRILSGWEQQGIVASGRRRIVIRRPHALVSVAEDLVEDRR
ncbi:MAG: Crp/Fnr family transcriptional regulator [Acidobacteriota bacterium]